MQNTASLSLTVKSLTSMVSVFFIVVTSISYIYTAVYGMSIPALNFANEKYQIKSAEEINTDSKPHQEDYMNILHYASNSTSSVTYTLDQYKSFENSELLSKKYNYCQMPHVNVNTYEIPANFSLKYVEVIHRHHKRTPYSSNMFPKVELDFDCDDVRLFYGASYKLHNSSNQWSSFVNVQRSQTIITNGPLQKLVKGTDNGKCSFPQISSGGLADSFKHGQDLWEVYGNTLGFLKVTDFENASSSAVEFRVSTNPITSQVASVLLQGMLEKASNNSAISPRLDIIVKIESESIDTLNAKYPCSGGLGLRKAYTDFSTNPRWAQHLSGAKELFQKLDSVSGIPSNDNDWHSWIDHYFDNLSFRTCHNVAYPCTSEGTVCINDQDALRVFEMGDWEYNYIYREASNSTAYAVSQSLYLWELVANLKTTLGTDSANQKIYQHNFAHDNTLAAILGVLQISPTLRWPGMGSELVFEVWNDSENQQYLRILYSGLPLKTAVENIGSWDMIPIDKFYTYMDQTIGPDGNKAVDICLHN